MKLLLRRQGSRHAYAASLRNVMNNPGWEPVRKLYVPRTLSVQPLNKSFKPHPLHRHQTFSQNEKRPRIKNLWAAAGSLFCQDWICKRNTAMTDARLPILSTGYISLPPVKLMSKGIISFPGAETAFERCRYLKER